MITGQWVSDEKIICSVMFKQYRLILYRDSLGYGYQLLDDGKNVQHYSARITERQQSLILVI